MWAIMNMHKQLNAPVKVSDTEAETPGQAFDLLLYRVRVWYPERLESVHPLTIEIARARAAHDPATWSFFWPSVPGYVDCTYTLREVD